MKPGSFTKLYIQLVFAVKYRECLIHENFSTELYKYISGIISGKDHKSIIVNGMPDHIHVFLGLNPNVSISDTVRDIKRSSSLFINVTDWLRKKFEWQDGYGAFSYSRSHLDNVYKYIQNQKQHHAKHTFKQEYTGLLKKFEIEYDERFLFNFFDK
ncbi:MAG: transposase [Bacteroidetes bacterium RIFCSPLOWO2_02_FULL_36_8]|nr:MAG: transposase [Bacteroidetes bacterium RIFCSPLOWO2_02_FULL_36_8]OFY69136.1 MAG: transposase [Bacteroidetes bacterium RIFCSPLOWO2_12_FULL_37_12]